MAARKGSRRSPGTAPAGSVGPGDHVVYPGVPGGVYDVLERLTATAGDSPDLGSPGLSLDRTRLVVRWFGDVPPAVQAVLDAGGSGVEVTVQPTDFRPGDLRAEAERLVREHPGVVLRAWARPEGDGIEVLVAPDTGTDPVTSAVPLFIEVGEPPPA